MHRTDSETARWQGATFVAAYRGLRAAPRTAVLAVAILTLAIAAGTLTFSVVDAVALRPLPFDQPDRLITIGQVSPTNPQPGVVSPQDFLSWKAEVPAFEGLAGSGLGTPLPLRVGDRTERLVTAQVTTDLFEVLRVRPILGPGLSHGHQTTGNDKVVVLSHAAWHRYFGANPGIIGTTVTFGTRGNDPRQVVGIMPAGFTFPVGPAVATDAWIPMVFRPNEVSHASPGRSYFVNPIGRLRADSSLELAQEQVSTVTTKVVAAHPAQTFWKDTTPVVLRLQDAVVGEARQWLILLLGAVTMVLLIAFANVANLLLARATVRTRELAVRTALGASRATVARMLVFESLLLSITSAVLGLALARSGLAALVAVLPADLARASTIALDGRVLSTAIGVALLTSVVFGLIPAWQGTQVDVMQVLKQGGGAIGLGRRGARWQRVLLTAQLAFVVALLVATAFFVASFVNVVRRDLGFVPGSISAFSISQPQAPPGDTTRAAASTFLNDTIARVRAVPGVLDAAMLDGGLPMFGNMSSYGIEIDGFGITTGADMVGYRAVSPNYFALMGIRVLEGRVFDSMQPGEPVVVINEEAARRFFRGRSAVGAHLTFRVRTRVIGVVSSVRMSGPESDVQPEMYIPFLQHDDGRSGIAGSLVVRTDPSTPHVNTAVQAALGNAVRSGAAGAPRLLDAEFAKHTAGRRFNAGLMTAFGMVGLLLAGVGIYGVFSFRVAQQTRTIGVRMALGATSSRIFREVLADTARLVSTGIALGLVGGWAISRLLQTVIFGVTGTEIWIYVFVGIGVGLVGIIAAALPARHAASVEPLAALRAE